MAYRRKNYSYWVRKFKPVQNHIEKTSAYDGAMFETFGPERDYVLSLANHADPEQRARVWTLVDGEGSSLSIINGYCLVNRLGYFITEVPFSGPESFMEVVG